MYKVCMVQLFIRNADLNCFSRKSFNKIFKHKSSRDISIFQFNVALSIRIILRNVLSLLHLATNSHNYHVLNGDRILWVGSWRMKFAPWNFKKLILAEIFILNLRAELPSCNYICIFIKCVTKIFLQHFYMCIHYKFNVFYCDNTWC